MIPYFPQKIAKQGLYLYLIALSVVTFLYFRYAMKWYYIAMGIAWVLLFFLSVPACSRKWHDLPRRQFLMNLGLTALGIRLVWVVFSYFFYIAHTGIPFEFGAADAMGYWDDGAWLSTQEWAIIKAYLFSDRGTVSDSGYIFYLTFLYKLIGANIFLTRVVQSIWSTATVLLLYNLGRRSVGEETGRLAGIMACFMPNLIFYCGLHLKETVMIFIIVAFLERADYLIRSQRYNVFTIALPVLLALSLFTFRTVLGAVAIFSLATALVFTSTKIIGRGKRILLIAWGVLAALTLWGGTIRTEVEGVWEDRGENQSARRNAQTASGNKWAKYATGTIMAPMTFVLPFPTMVDVDEQYNQQMLHGGNYVRNFLGCFVLITFFNVLFITKNWRDLSLIGSFGIAYLFIISMSAFASAERFLLPALPMLLLMSAYGVTHLDAKSYKFVKIWYYIVPIMSIAWAYFKLGSRGLF